jgi:hypothetical protein
MTAYIFLCHENQFLKCLDIVCGSFIDLTQKNVSEVRHVAFGNFDTGKEQLYLGPKLS